MDEAKVRSLRLQWCVCERGESSTVLTDCSGTLSLTECATVVLARDVGFRQFSSHRSTVYVLFKNALTSAV